MGNFGVKNVINIIKKDRVGGGEKSLHMFDLLI